MTFVNELIEANLNKDVISICYNKIDWNNRLVGFVKKIDSKKGIFEFQEINEYGRFLKLKNLDIENIFCIELNDRYNVRLKFIVNNQKLYSFKKYSKRIAKGNHKKELLKLKDLKQITTFYFDNEYVTGFLSDFTSSYVKIKNIDYFAEEDGVSFFMLNTLTKIRTGSLKENKIQIIYQNKNNINS